MLSSSLFAESPLPSCLNQLEQITLRSILLNHVDVSIILESCVQLDDVGMVQLYVEADLTLDLKPAW